MMKFVVRDLHERIMDQTPRASATAFAPSNIALCKYWGKRSLTGNLPLNDSLSISLNDLGAKTCIKVNFEQDQFYLNHELQKSRASFAKRLSLFLDPFRTEKSPYFTVESHLNIPYAAGLASSACGFAAASKAINKLLSLNLDKKSLSQMSRLGSGSASRSHWHGFVHWHSGDDNQGRDCFAEPVPYTMPELRIGIIITENHRKPMSSREAMQKCFIETTAQEKWQSLSQQSISIMLKAISRNDWPTLGRESQNHAEAMHSLIQKHCGPIYHNNHGLKIKNQVDYLQKQGHNIFWTQDAGPQIKLLFLKKDEPLVQSLFDPTILVNPWGYQHE